MLHTTQPTSHRFNLSRHSVTSLHYRIRAPDSHLFEAFDVIRN